MTEQTFSIREAVPTDADQLLSVMSKIGSETPYLVMDERGMAMSTAELAENLATLYESPNNVLLVALAGKRSLGPLLCLLLLKSGWSILVKLALVF